MLTQPNLSKLATVDIVPADQPHATCTTQVDRSKSNKGNTGEKGPFFFLIGLLYHHGSRTIGPSKPNKIIQPCWPGTISPSPRDNVIVLGRPIYAGPTYRERMTNRDVISTPSVKSALQNKLKYMIDFNVFNVIFLIEQYTEFSTSFVFNWKCIFIDGKKGICMTTNRPEERTN